MSWNLRKYGLYTTIIAIVCLFLMVYRQPSDFLQDTTTPEHIPVQLGERYLVDTEKCKIPNLNPWNPEVQPLYIKKPHVKCSTKSKLTQIVYRADGAFLKVDERVRSQYSDNNISCCYSNVTRDNGEYPDLGVRISACIRFEDSVKLYEVSILVKCQDAEHREIYANTHSVFPKKPGIQEKINIFRGKPKPPSILLIGIDSMSRLNFHRVFSNTKQYLHENDWLEYRGYNKIGDNTFPNLMGLLSGRNLSRVLGECDPKRLDDCNFIWKDYRKLGYVTAHAEDEITINTFTTYTYKGFQKEPADYYYVPYLEASEQLQGKKMEGMSYCTGPETSAERILNIAKDMVLTFPEHPKFGFFWMNSFSHDDINAPGRVDEIFANFFRKLQRHINNNTIVIFFSDHGIRFGSIRLTRSGWLEERLPFLYFWIPKSFKQRFPEQTQYITKNSFKLTTPYDIYMTLQDILVLSNLDYVSKPSEGCAKCRSLFGFINDRSCEDVMIHMHWCTCFGYDYLSPNSEVSFKGSSFAISEINNILQNNVQTNTKCSKYTLRKVISTGISDNNIYNKTFLLLIFETVPKAIYEATVSVFIDGMEQLFVGEGTASRLDRYATTSTCVNEYYKLYCYCSWNVMMELNSVSFWFEI